MAAVVEAPTERRDFFTYAINFANLPPGNTAEGQIQIQSDSDFELQKMAQFADIAGGAQTATTRVLPLVTLQITDTGTGRQVFQAPVPIPGVFGDGQIPFILPVTKMFSRNASVAFSVANYSAATTYNLRLLMIGAKIFKY
jgi:hypothetical protein